MSYWLTGDSRFKKMEIWFAKFFMRYADESWPFIKLPLNGYPRYTWYLGW
jgi:hypothetical protein